MKPAVIVVMKNGEQHFVVGFEDSVTRQVADARREGVDFLRLERDRIPTGQMIALDPRDVSTIRGR